MHRDFFPAGDGDGSKISIGSGVNDNAINAVIPKGLAAQIEHRRVHIEQVRQTKLASLCFGGIAFAFCFRRSYSAVCKCEMGSDFF